MKIHSKTCAEVCGRSTFHRTVQCMPFIVGLLLLSCGEDASAPVDDGPLEGDGLVIEGAPGNVVCVPGSITIRNTAKTSREIWDLLGQNHVLGPGESWTEPLTVVGPAELNVIQVGTFRRRRTIRLLTRGERLDLPPSIQYKVVPRTSTPELVGDVAVENPSDHTLWVTFATTGGLVPLNQKLRLMPHEASGTRLNYTLPLVDPKAGLRTRLEIVTGECDPVSTLVNVEVTP